MFKWIIGIILTVIASMTLFLIISPYLLPHITNYRYNTIFASSPYSDNKLKRIKIGASMSEVIESIGEPLSKDEIEYMHCVLYTQGSNSLDAMSAKYHGIGGSAKEPFLVIWFTEEGKVNYIFNSKYTEIANHELIGLDVESILDKFGEPKQTLTIPKCYVWSYSKIVDGPHTGCDRGIYTRRVFFDESQKVFVIEKGKGASFDIYKALEDLALTSSNLTDTSLN